MLALYSNCRDEMPTKPGCHPFLLIREDAVHREVTDSDCLHKELHVHSDKSIDGIFISTKDASQLGLTETGMAETLYGPVKRYTPLHISFLSHSHSLPVKNVYQLPPPFENTHLEGGIIGIAFLFSLGVSVAYDRGFVYLIRSGLEPLVMGADRPDEGNKAAVSHTVASTDDEGFAKVNAAFKGFGLGLVVERDEDDDDDDDDEEGEYGVGFGQLGVASRA